MHYLEAEAIRKGEREFSADVMAFVEAIAEAFPPDAPRDRFGRYSGPRNCEPLRQLAVKYAVGSAFDTQEQAGKIARAILGN